MVFMSNTKGCSHILMDDPSLRFMVDGGSYFPKKYAGYADMEMGQIKQVLFMIAVVTIVFLI